MNQTGPRMTSPTVVVTALNNLFRTMTRARGQ